MNEYLNFEEVASVLNCSTAKVRQFVVEDKTLKATRITPNGMVLESPVWDGHCAYDLNICDHLSDEGVITSDTYGHDSTGQTVVIKTSDVGFLRIERSDLNTFIAASAIGMQSVYELSRRAASKAEAPPAIEEKPLSTIERNTLLTIIAVLCKEAKLDYTKHAKTAGFIQGTADGMGVSIGETTIEGHLKKIPNALAGRMK